MGMRARQSVIGYLCVCVRERERECARLCVFEREWVCALEKASLNSFVHARKRERCGCVREKTRERERDACV